MGRQARSNRVHQLRDLCAWYEWSEPPHRAAADALQAAADALREGSLSIEAADVLIAVWQPHGGLEAAVGKPPRTHGELGAIRYAVGDLRRMLKNASDDDKPRIAALLREQIRILESLEGRRRDAAA